VTTMSDRTPPTWGGYGDRNTARRAAARQHHPDVGGSATALTAAFADIDRAYGYPTHGSPDVVITIVHRGIRTRARTLATVGTLRTALVLNKIRTRAGRVAGAARSSPRGARRAQSTSLEESQ
jgi:hypothetical protein